MRPDNRSKTLRHRLISCVALGAMTVNVFAPIAAAEAQTLSPSSTRAPRTSTPIKHLIVVIGENRSFDNVFATYVPPDPSQSVWNLLSQGIVDITGKPGLNAAKALQQQATDQGTYQLAPSKTVAFSTLPQPSTTLSAIPYSPCLLSTLLSFAGKNPAGYSFCNDPGLSPPMSNLSLTKGGTGQPFYFPSDNIFPVPDCRYPSNLPNAPYSLVGASVTPSNCQPLTSPFIAKPGGVTKTVFSDNTGDPLHRFFQMWQQNDCSNASRSPLNPSGCLHDLYTWVATSVGWQITQSGSPPTDDQQTFQGGVAMGFYNMADGDYPYFQSLAHQYAISDNYHQPVMGGTGANSQLLLTGDVFYYTDSQGNAATPPANLIENPDPQCLSEIILSHVNRL
jgi:phospholipase C